MSNKSNISIQCSHQDIVHGPRGANWSEWGCFLHFQNDDFKDQVSTVFTLNMKNQWIKNDIVPFEYYDSLLKQERLILESLNHNFSKKVMQIRKRQIDYIIELGDRFGQSNLTIHIAVDYLNKALKKHSEMLTSKLYDPSVIDTDKDHWNLWAGVCLMLASKYNEIDCKIPFYKEIKKASSRADVYTEQQFHIAEEFIIKSVLNWELISLTSLHFTQWFLYQGILFEDDKFTGTQEKIIKSLSKKSELFTDLALASEKITNSDYEKSKIAVGWIIASRKICKIKPLWNNKLYNMTGYHFFVIKDILDILIRDYWDFFNEDYSKFMYAGAVRNKNIQKPLSFVSRRASENPQMQCMLSHAQSTKSLRIDDSGISNSQIRSTIIDCDIKSKKLAALDGDTISSALSIPDESETDIDTSREFDKVNEKILSRSGTADTQESEKVKIYTMQFQNMKIHESSNKRLQSQVALQSRYKNAESYFSTEKVSIDYRNNKPYRYKKTSWIQKPFENTIGKVGLIETTKMHQQVNRSAVWVNKIRKVHESIMNSNGKVISNKKLKTNAKVWVNLAKDIFANMRKSLRTSKKNSIFNETFSTSPKLGNLGTSGYVNQKTGTKSRVGFTF